MMMMMIPGWRCEGSNMYVGPVHEATYKANTMAATAGKEEIAIWDMQTTKFHVPMRTLPMR
jgi:hypothetical protein